MTTTDLPQPGELPEVEVDPSAFRHLADAQVNVELDTGDMVLNIGPQHPATHGTLRLVVRLDGERVVGADPIIGYMHRGYEKLVEYRTYPQVTTLINRIDWLSSFANEVPFIAGAEVLMGIEAPPRALYIRTILTELSRIATFLLFLGEMGLQVGAITPAFYGFRDREYVLNLIEAVTGGRFHPNFNRIGGLKEDLPWGWIADAKTCMNKVLASCDEFEDLVVGNPIFEKRTRSIGIIPAALGASYGVSGSNLRASGVDWDLRRDAPKYLVYDELDWKVWTHPDGDSFARYWVRLQETRESARMVLQMLEQMPAGPIMAKVPRIIKVPEGEVWVNTENPLGEMGYYIFSKGATGPFRVKIRSASFSNVSILPWLLRGVYIPDIITILASLYFILGDIDRLIALDIGWGTTLAVKTIIVLGIVPLTALILGYVFLLKMMSHMQSRLGPMDPGGFHGWYQLIGDGIKFLQKEDIMPAEADTHVFALAPAIVVLSTFLVFVVIPAGPRLVVAPLDVGVFYALAVSSLSVIGVLMAGWASANKYALIGALRAAAQLIAYELPLVLAVVGVVVQAGTMNLQLIVHAQQGGSIFGWSGIGQPYILTQFVGFALFMVAAQAELTQPPFDMPVAESELVAGYMVEYTGFRFLFFFIGEFGTAFAFAALAATMFLGGWSIPGVHGTLADFLGPGVLFAKVMLVAFLMFWARFTYPRFREDQLQALAWKWLIPIALINILLTGLLKVAFWMKREIKGMLTGLGVTFRTMTKRVVTVQYPHEREDPPARARGVIALKEENCTVCMLCARSCPDWCIYIEGHKEQRPPRREGGRPRSVSILDRFDIDYALCMYCGICVEVCPFDALFWTPEFEYSETRIADLLHDKDRLGEWMDTVPETEPLEIGAEVKGKK